MLRQIARFSRFPRRYLQSGFTPSPASIITNAELDKPGLIYRKHGRVTVIGINNPDRRNALNEDLVGKLKEALDDYEADKNACVAVLFGEGGNFCAGYDLKELDERGEINIPTHFINNDLTDRFMKKPLIGAISGYAVGVGFDLALMCDIRLMEETSAVGCLGRRYGVPMSDVGIARMQATLGLSRSMDLLLSGRLMKEKEAHESGFCTRITSCGTVIGQGLNLALSILKFPEKALLLDRARLYKHAYSKIKLKHSEIDKEASMDAMKEEELIQYIKKGAAIFANGGGKKAKLFSSMLWLDD